jgi:hypothetical protein
MAYERTWQFMAVKGPYIPASNVQNPMYFYWIWKRMLTGQSDVGITQGLWTIYASSDGTTSGYDSTDRWGDPFALPNQRITVTGAPIAWIVLTRSIGGVPVYLTIMGSHLSGSTNESNAIWTLSSSAPTGGSTTTTPTITNALRTQGVAGLQPIFNTNIINARHFYGGITSLGDFWIASTVNGEIEYWAMVVAPVGCKTNDAYPVYANGGTYCGSVDHIPFGANKLYTPAADTVGKMYNGATGYPFLAPPFPYAQLDASDVSLYDFPTWVIVGNATTPTVLHARGRVADMGLIAGNVTPTTGATSRPCPIGTCVRDPLGDVKYVTLNQMLVPYNALLS